MEKIHEDGINIFLLYTKYCQYDLIEDNETKISHK